MEGLNAFKLFLGIASVLLATGAVVQAVNVIRPKRSVDPKDSANEAEEASGGGQTYIRWGRTTCPEHPDTYLVYKGMAGGTWYDHKGGASNLLCLSEDPVWGTYDDKLAGHGNLHGVEYETGWPLENDNIEGESHVDQDVPCALCWVPHRTTMMIPGRKSCVPGWRLEYHGYVMADRNTHHRGEFICVDHAPEAHPGGAANKGGALLFYIEAYCGQSLRCPPYIHGREIACAVCAR